jgi:sugar diacid utilization regulator
VALTLSNVLQLPILRAAKVLTDPAIGGQRQVASVSVIEVPVGRFIRPGEFVMSSGMKIGRNARLMAKFVDEIAHGGASALAIAVGPHTPLVPTQAIQTANRRKLPIIELPWELRFSEVTEAILRQIISETGKLRSRDEFVWSLTSGNISEDAARARAEQLGFDLSQPCVGIVAKVSKPEGQSAHHAKSEARFVEGLCSRAAGQHQLHWVGTVAEDTVIGYLQAPGGKLRVPALLNSLTTAARDRCVISWGIGRLSGAFADFAKSYDDARVACQLGIATRGKGCITEVADILADRMLLQVRQDALAAMLLRRYIEPLARFQRIPLLRTLEMFFGTDCNASETARKLAISRQSLLYRLKKIESALNMDLHNSENRFALLLSLRLHKLQRSSQLQRREGDGRV